MSIPTSTELRNEAREALNRAIKARDEGAQEQYDSYWDEYVEKNKAAEAAAEREAAVKIAEDSLHVDEADLRDHKDAALPIKTLAPDQAKEGVMIHAKDGHSFEVVQYASKSSEGWIKGYPASVQHPEIMKRLTPELAIEAQQERDAFCKWARFGMRGLTEDERKAMNRLKDPASQKDLQEGTDAEGGFLVPTDQRSEVIMATGVPNGVTRPISRTWTTTRDAGNWPASTDDVDFAVVAEEATFGEDDPTFSQVSFTIRKVGRMAQVAEELLEDSAVNVPALLNLLFGNGIGRYEDQQAIEGDGTTEPLGIRTAGAAQGNIADVLFASATAVVAADLTNAFFTLPAQWRSRATWHTTSSFIRQVSDIQSTGNGIHFIEDLRTSPGTVLLGRPVVMYDGTGWDDAVAIAANEEVGCIGDFSQYYFIDRVGLTVTRDSSRYFETDQVAFKARKRYDSLFAENDAFRILKAAAS